MGSMNETAWITPMSPKQKLLGAINVMTGMCSPASRMRVAELTAPIRIPAFGWRQMRTRRPPKQRRTRETAAASD